MTKNKKAKSKAAKTLQLSPTEKFRRQYMLEDCKSYKELAEFIEGNPTYKLMSRGLVNPKDFHLFVGRNVTLPAFGITEEISIGNLPKPDSLYRRVKLRFLELHKQNPVSITGAFPDEDKPLDGLEYIVMACRAGEAAIEYSAPLQTGQWAEIFGKSEGTIRKWMKAKDVYHFQRVSDRLYRLPKNEIPPDYYLEKFNGMIKEQARKMANNSERKA